MIMSTTLHVEWIYACKCYLLMLHEMIKLHIFYLEKCEVVNWRKSWIGMMGASGSEMRCGRKRGRGKNIQLLKMERGRESRGEIPCFLTPTPFCSALFWLRFLSLLHSDSGKQPLMPRFPHLASLRKKNFTFHLQIHFFHPLFLSLWR